MNNGIWAMKSRRPGKAQRRYGFLALGVAALAFGGALAARADTFTQPTKEELEMKSVPGYPNAAAVVLYQEEITNDDLHVIHHYQRIKILTDEGKKYANVQLHIFSAKDAEDFDNEDTTVEQIQARTIHPDGTVIPFTGKPYLKKIEDSKYGTQQEKVFTLPDADVGSILEYRYNTRVADHWVQPPDWRLQGDLFVKKAHYEWFPTTKNNYGTFSHITIFPVLRKQDEFSDHTLATGGKSYTLTAVDIPPVEKEEYMPPIGNFTLRVSFNYTGYHSIEEFWKEEGKSWSKNMNSFAGPNGALRDATQTIIAGATTDDEKLRRIYAAVQKMDNTSFSREHGQKEDKLNGLKKVNTAADAWKNQRGTPTEITLVLVGMARAAGLQADAMLVPNRSFELVTKNWQTLRQFDDVIAAVKMAGKDLYLDPGSPFEPYGRLAWEHTFLPEVLRQSQDGAVWAMTPGDSYLGNQTFREANLTMDEHGAIHGTIKMTYIGQPAVRWRQIALREDEESLHKRLEDSLHEMLPKTVDVKLEGIENLTDATKSLIVRFDTSGGLGTPAGKRVMLPGDLFLAGATSPFPHETREMPVYFPYSETVRDALRINLPPNLTPEAVPDSATYKFGDTGVYHISTTYDPTQFTTRRDFVSNAIIVPPTDYPKLRSFYSQFEAKDQENVVVKQVSGHATTEMPASPGKN